MERMNRIREEGSIAGPAAQRLHLLKTGLRMNISKQSPTVIVLGCYNPFTMVGPLTSFKLLLDYYAIDYTLLKKEHCCGGILIHESQQQNKAETEDFARSALQWNIDAALELGAKELIAFCPVCYVLLKRFHSSTLAILSYGELLERHFTTGFLEKEIDYFEGCYSYHKRISSMDYPLEPFRRMLSKITGLTVHHLRHNHCCTKNASRITDKMITDTIVTVCTGCHIKTSQTIRETANSLFFTDLLLASLQSPSAKK